MFSRILRDEQAVAFVVVLFLALGTPAEVYRWKYAPRGVDGCLLGIHAFLAAVMGKHLVGVGPYTRLPLFGRNEVKRKARRDEQPSEHPENDPEAERCLCGRAEYGMHLLYGGDSIPALFLVFLQLASENAVYVVNGMFGQRDKQVLAVRLEESDEPLCSWVASDINLFHCL